MVTPPETALAVDLRGRRLLLTGRADVVVARVHECLRLGAMIDVCADSPSTALRDLAERGLVRIAPVPVLSSYDVVLSCRPPRSSENGGGPVAPQVRALGDRSSRDNKYQGMEGGAADGRAGEVVLVGGGPGDPGLLTVAALAELRAADVVVYDRLAPLAALAEAPAHAVLVDVGKIPRGEFTPQERINDVLVEHARAGRRVVRFKGGDNFVFGRGGEEAIACAEAGIPVRVVPGVTSSIAGPALAGIPVTHRTLTQGVTVVSGHVPPGDPRSTLDWAALARARTTIVVLMGVRYLPEIAAALVDAGLPAATPAATIADAALPSMRTVRAPLGELAGAIEAAGLGAPAVTVIGDVAALDVLAAAARDDAAAALTGAAPRA